MKNECGHPVSAEESVLICSICDVQRAKMADDATWNAAIEAAAKTHDAEVARIEKEMEPEELSFEWWNCLSACKGAHEASAERIRALKREAK